MTGRVLVHADGGACHGTPVVDGRCPKCGIAPDMQSVELWPAPVHDGPPGHGEECSPTCPACAVLMAPRRLAITRAVGR